ncbi:ferredoxin [Streptomyces sp. NPDC087658]|uniref:ferredoxin n=1 Tax=Streptomyces sp. NPDC087658 TaxID=3365800 RepID=UPI003805A8CC
MTRRITLDRDVCIGSGLCAATAPRHFVLDRDRRSALLPGAGEPDGSAEDAVALCPVEAISLVPPPAAG